MVLAVGGRPEDQRVTIVFDTLGEKELLWAFCHNRIEMEKK